VSIIFVQLRVKQFAIHFRNERYNSYLISSGVLKLEIIQEEARAHFSIK